MLTPAQTQFLQQANVAATSAAHIFPAAAACEAALESGFGISELSGSYFNLFGQKQQVHPIYGTVHIPTKEYLEHHWVSVDAAWVVFPDWAASFKSRMDTLRRMAPTYPYYASALQSTTPEEFVTWVSKSWSTDPDRAKKVLSIYHSHLDILKG